MRLENIEWTNTWRENARDDVPRVLLIGDSITQGYRSIVNRMLEGKIRVTAFSTSKAIDNIYLYDEIALLTRQEGNRYMAVHFNNGLHGGGLSPKEYASHYEQMLDKLMALLPDTPVILTLSTPVAEREDLGTYGERNDRVIEFNDEVRAIAARRGLPVDDLYSVVYGKKELFAQDGIHYNAGGYEALATSVTASITAL